MTDPEDKTAVDHDTTVFYKRPASSQPQNRIKIIEGEPHLKECRFGNSIMIGRGAECGLTIENDRYVSREHARIQRRKNNKFQLTNLVSKNTTLLNGKAITKPTSLKTGDRIQVGDTTLEVTLEGSKTGININVLKSSKIKPVLYGFAILLMVVIAWNIIPWPSSEIQGYLEKGDQFYKQEQYEQAKDQYQLVLDIDSEHKEARNKYQKCEKKITERENEKKINQYLIKGKKCLEREDYLCALDYYKRILDINNTHSEAIQKKDEVERRLNEQYNELIEKITNLIDKAEKLTKSTDFTSLKDLETLDAKDKQLKLAEKYVNQAIALCDKVNKVDSDGSRRKAMQVLTSIQQSKDEIKKEIDDLKKVKALYLKAKDFSDRNEFFKALLTLEDLVALNVSCEESIKARQIIPRLKQTLINAVKSLYNQGIKLYKKQKYSKAITHFHQVYAIYPKYQEIERFYHDTIKKLEPKAQRSLDEGNVYEGIGKLDEARKKWNEALILMPIESHEIHQEAKLKLSGQ